MGTTAQCVTGRLATLEEIVDWQPFERIAWRLAVAGLGPVAAIADLDRVEGGTRLRLRWGFLGESPVPHDEVARIAVEKEAAFARLATVVATLDEPRGAATDLDIGATPRFALMMRIGELAREVGVSTDTVRFYERSGWLPRASRRDNAYREYGDQDVEHLRLIIDLRRLDVPLEDAARIAGWCHSGHCADSTTELPRLIAERRADIADRVAGLQALDERLAGLQAPPRSAATIAGGRGRRGSVLRSRRRRRRIGAGRLRLLHAGICDHLIEGAIRASRRFSGALPSRSESYTPSTRLKEGI